MGNRNFSKSLEKKVKKFAKAMENRMDVGQYQELLFGLLFMKCASESGDGENGLTVSGEAHWNHLKSRVHSPYFGGIVANALKGLENSNISLKGLLSPDFGKVRFSSDTAKYIFEFVDSIAIHSFQTMDIFGRIYEYLNTGPGGRISGIFFTPDCVAKLLVEMLQPFGGIIYDPCCGTGTMFVHAINFIRKNRRCARGVYFYGQESNPFLARLCRLNLALRGFDSSCIGWNTEGSLLKDAFPDVKARFILTNPPFNQKDWGREKLKNDPRWLFGIPPKENGNFAWIQHVVSHLQPVGRAGILLSNGSLSTQTTAESKIRKGLVDNSLVECIAALPDRLFYNTGIPVCLWFLGCAKEERGHCRREILFIDARSFGRMKNRKKREFSDQDIRTITGIYHQWRSKDGNYRDISGLCKSVDREEVHRQDYVLTPSCYVGIPRQKDNDTIPFQRKIKQLASEFTILRERGEEMDRIILERLGDIGQTLEC